MWNTEMRKLPDREGQDPMMDWTCPSDAVRSMREQRDVANDFLLGFRMVDCTQGGEKDGLQEAISACFQFCLYTERRC
jgi:hypothetical protein